MFTRIAKAINEKDHRSSIYETTFDDIKSSISSGILKDFPGNRRSTLIAKEKFITKARYWDRDIASEGPIDICIFRNFLDVEASNSRTIQEAFKKEKWVFPFIMVADGHGRCWAIGEDGIESKDKNTFGVFYRIHPARRFREIFESRNITRQGDIAFAPDSSLRHKIETALGSELSRTIFEKAITYSKSSKFYTLARYAISTNGIDNKIQKYNRFQTGTGVKKTLISYTRSKEACDELDMSSIKKFGTIYSGISKTVLDENVRFSVSMFLLLIDDAGYEPKLAFSNLLQNTFEFAKWFTSMKRLHWAKALERVYSNFDSFEALISDKAQSKLFRIKKQKAL